MGESVPRLLILPVAFCPFSHERNPALLSGSTLILQSHTKSSTLYTILGLLHFQIHPRISVSISIKTPAWVLAGFVPTESIVKGRIDILTILRLAIHKRALFPHVLGFSSLSFNILQLSVSGILC